uniref:Putative vitamin B12-binding domain containing protein n=1 Tax=viral metagenome TaxID=1070528 RepID=A0A6M3KVJ3_9ZZZZ
MNVVFVQSEHESLAIEIFSSVLKSEGHNVSLVYDTRLFDSMELKNNFLFRIFDIREKLVDKVISLKPDLIAFSVLTDGYQWALGMARMIKERTDTPIIFGGFHPTICPEEVIKEDCVDIVCVGEGEQAIVELANNPKNRNIKNLWYKNKRNPQAQLIDNLDNLPFPDKRLFYDQQPNITGNYGLLTARGCPFNCSYCASEILNRIKGYLRRRSPENVIDEILYAQNTVGYRINIISFWDDTFTYDLDWLKKFLSLYKEKVNLPFHCTGFPMNITLEKTKLLKDAGCFRLGMGVQSVSERTRKNILHRPGLNSQIRQAVKSCKEAGLSIWFDHILNIPTETEKEQEEALDFYNEVRPDIINVFWLVYYPKTKIVGFAKQLGIINNGMTGKINRGEMTTAQVGRIGGNYSFGKQNFKGYAFLFHLLPLLPPKVMQFIIDRGWFRKSSPPTIINYMIKLLVRIKLHQTWESLWFVYITFKRMGDNIRIKWIKRY